MNESGAQFSSFATAIILMILLSLSSSLGDTDPRDVVAINNLYAALGSPPLPGWLPNGGDPCKENWQGVQCVNSNITAIILNGANLGGQLGDKLGYFASIITFDLSDNHIGGTIPENLPSTIRQFFVSANQLTGNIPSSLAELSLLSDMSVNNNNLNGELPDAFQSLTSLVNLDISFNNFSGQLPPSFGNLSSLSALHVQNNRLSGFLDVLQFLPLSDLNVEKNLFFGPVPEKLFKIPNFKMDGNPFNTTPAPSSMPLLPTSPFIGAPVPSGLSKSVYGPAAILSSNGGERGFSSKTAVLCIIVAVGTFAILSIVLFGLNLLRRKSKFSDSLEEEDGKEQLCLKEPVSKNLLASQKYVLKEQKYGKGSVLVEKSKSISVDCVLDMPETSICVMLPSSGRLPANSENIIREHPLKLTSFSFSTLQQYSNNFDEDQCIRDGRYGKIYLLQLPNKKFLEAMKLNTANFEMTREKFLELALCVNQLRHPNISELVGYCCEREEWILVYRHCGIKSLRDVLHLGDGLRDKLCWNTRLRLALGVAKALEYLHEDCRPPSIHRNIESASIFLDDDLAVYVAECGLGSVITSNLESQFPSRRYSPFICYAPEVHTHGSYTDRSDVYSFGVVMLELLTGRKPFDCSRDRGEQHLVRWSSSRLHEMNALSRMVDPAIRGKYSEKSLSRFADIISRCIQVEPEFRPPMSQVVQDLTLVMEETGKI